MLPHSLRRRNLLRREKWEANVAPPSAGSPVVCGPVSKLIEALRGTEGEAGNMDTAPISTPIKDQVNEVPECLWLFSGGKV
jgi:hypothetical protein